MTTDVRLHPTSETWIVNASSDSKRDQAVVSKEEGEDIQDNRDLPTYHEGNST